MERLAVKLWSTYCQFLLMRARELPLGRASDALTAWKCALAHPVGITALGMKQGRAYPPHQFARKGLVTLKVFSKV